MKFNQSTLDLSSKFSYISFLFNMPCYRSQIKLTCHWLPGEYMNNNLLTTHPFGSQITAATLQQMFTGLLLWEEKYRQLILLGQQLSPLPDALKQENIAISGCENRVWFSHQRLDDGRFHFYGDSESRIVKGLLAILLTSVEGKTAEQLLVHNPLELFDILHLTRQLSASRGKGLTVLAHYIRQSVSTG